MVPAPLRNLSAAEFLAVGLGILGYQNERCKATKQRRFRAHFGASPASCLPRISWRKPSNSRNQNHPLTTATATQEQDEESVDFFNFAFWLYGGLVQGIS
jgi:hypothetical protein